jgi:hypothetical protein
MCGDAEAGVDDAAVVEVGRDGDGAVVWLIVAEIFRFLSLDLLPNLLLGFNVLYLMKIADLETKNGDDIGG